MKQIQNKWNKRIIVMISSVCLFCLTVMLCLISTLANQHFMLEQNMQSGYAKKVAAEINREIQSYHYEIGAPAEALEKIVTEELVQKNIELFIRNRYEKEPAELIGEKEVEEKLQEIINTYKQEEAEDDPFASEENNLLIYMTSGIFRRGIQSIYLMSFIDQILTIRERMVSFLPVISSILLVLLSGVFYLYRMSWKKVLWSFAVVIGGAGFQLLSLSVSLYLYDMTSQLDIRTQALQHLLDTYILSFIQFFSVVAIVEVAIAAGLWWIGKRVNTEKRFFQKETNINNKRL
ncbi:hypothetical protein NHN13_01465 [Enterococcus faecium]|uniref:hypothetical protein n=1 Tax=Enterococcus faecium TaxID=1352 RepID=UPI002263D984|nr:hypothetical protein [Enterococcus faecium]UZX18171.1 hypothetical protein NHN13_01465 [Enterococcus faecium]